MPQHIRFRCLEGTVIYSSQAKHGYIQTRICDIVFAEQIARADQREYQQSPSETVFRWGILMIDKDMRRGSMAKRVAAAAARNSRSTKRARSRKKKGMALKEIFYHPAVMLILCLCVFMLFWLGYLDSDARQCIALLCIIAYSMVLVLRP